MFVYEILGLVNWLKCFMVRLMLRRIVYYFGSLIWLSSSREFLGCSKLEVENLFLLCFFLLIMWVLWVICEV